MHRSKAGEPTRREYMKYSVNQYTFTREFKCSHYVVYQYEKNQLRISRQSLIWGMCVPSSCTAADLQTSLDRALRPVFKRYNFEIDTEVLNPFYPCGILEEAPHYPEEYYYANACFQFLFFIVMSATVYDLTIGRHGASKNDHVAVKLLRCFSAIHNYKMLTQVRSNNTESLLHFIKIICMISVLWFHATKVYQAFTKFENEEMEMIFSPSTLELLFFMEPLLMDTFFLLGGFVRFFYFDFSPKNDNYVRYFVRSILLRWFRLVPLLGLLILHIVFILPHTCDFPISVHEVMKEINHCRSNWWMNILAVQNINSKEMCFFPSWSVATDIQLFIVGTVIALSVRKNRKHGIFLLITAFLCSVIYTIITMSLNDIEYQFTGFINVARRKPEEPFITYKLVHSSTTYRAIPYFIGCMTALLTRWMLEKGFTFSRMQSILWPLLLSAAAIGVHLYRISFLMVGRQSYLLEKPICIVLQSILFALPLASLICAHFVSGFGVLNRIFESKLRILLPIGKLAYGVQLLSVPIQEMHVFGHRSSLPSYSQFEIIWWMVTDTIFTLFAAFLFFLVAEGPVLNMKKLLQQHLKTK